MISGTAAIGANWFLNGISHLQDQITKTTNALASGYQVNSAADDPAHTPDLIDLGSTLASLQTYQTNLGSVQNEAQTADSALSSAISLLQNARGIAVQATQPGLSAADLQSLATQVQGIQQQLVSIANTKSGDKYIFGGDQSTSAPYQYDATAATGVDNLTTQGATWAFVNPDGQTVYQPLTAQQIFDDQDASGTPTANNVFAALQSLATALQTQDTTGITNSISSLETSYDWVNQKQAYYGSSEQRLTAEQNSVANRITSVQTGIGTIRDTNVVEAATELTQETAAQSAAYEAEAAIPKKSLFDYLG